MPLTPPTHALRTTPALLPPLVRAIDWTPFAAVIPLALAITTLGAPTPAEAIPCLRVAAVLLAAAAAFALIDPMEPSTAALPVPRSLRQNLRTLLALIPITLTWTTIAAVVAARSPTPLPWSGLTLEAGMLTATTLALAAVTVHRVPGKPAAAIATAALLALLAGTLPLSLWPAPGTPTWPRAHHLWLAALPIPLLTLLTANHHPFRRTT
ncbi:hypothetical protein [Embleya sp. AB8]|uniref:hypothetical protein n=1 Tax=Embleya sp. AB8 TaxID=3156304 RepID=UPI003C76B870